MSTPSTVAASLLSQLSAAPDRRPGSPANDAAVDLAASVLADLGWTVLTPEFPVIAWDPGTASLAGPTGLVALAASPYGRTAAVTGPLVPVTSRDELSALRSTGGGRGAVLLLRGELTREPLTPPAFPFFQVPEDVEVRDHLIASGAAAVVSVTGRFPATCGAVEPFAFVEDGELPVPVADAHPRDERTLLNWTGAPVDLRVDARRRDATARNVVARNHGTTRGRILITAHIDTKPGTPGALDNAAGVVTALRAAALLRHADTPVEVVLFNGEDHFAAPGESAWLTDLADMGQGLDDIGLDINIDAAGARDRPVVWSGYHLSPDQEVAVTTAMSRHGIEPGPAWYQSDHGIFALAGRPAVALTSDGIDDLLNTVVHAPHDTAGEVDPDLLDAAAGAIADTVTNWA